MSASGNNQQLIAFFGATGGCALACLTRTLSHAATNPGIHANVLARNPAKLSNLLLARGFPDNILDAHLTVTSGDVKDIDAVSKTLRSTSTPGKTADLIISGIGGTPKFQISIRTPVTLNDPTICEDSIRTILSSLRRIQSQNPRVEKPVVVTVSTTGLSKRQRDVPLAILPIYHYLGAVPHKDKLVAEDMLEDAAFGADSPVKGFVVVRPSLLMDGESKPGSKVRVGWEWSPRGGPEGNKSGVSPALEGDGLAEPKVEVGYTITRDDVGKWMFEQMVQGAEGSREKWLSKMVTLTE